MQDTLDIDIYAGASPFKKDVLLIHGTKDELVPLRISERYNEIYGDRAKLIALEGAGHGFETVEYRELLLKKNTRIFCGSLEARIKGFDRGAGQ